MSDACPPLNFATLTGPMRKEAGRLDIFKDLNLEVYAGEIVALVGQSGAGKSSLLHIAGLLEAPTAGEVFISGQNCTALDDTARTRIRRIGIGFVYQFHHLLPEFSARRKCHHAAADCGVAKYAAVRTRQGAAVAAGAGRTLRTSPLRAFRWRTAARGHRTGHCQPAAAAAGR